MASFDNNKNNNNGRAVFNSTTSSAALSTIELIEPDNISMSSINNQMETTGACHLNEARGTNQKMFTVLKPVNNFTSVKFLGTTVQLRLPLFVLIILALFVLFLVVSLFRSVFFNNVDSDTGIDVTFDSSNSTEFQRLVFEARENFDEYIAETMHEEENAHYLTALVNFIEICLRTTMATTEPKSEATKNEISGRRTEATMAENNEGNDGAYSTSTTTTTTTAIPSADRQQWEDERAQREAEHHRKMRPVCEKVLEWLQKNPWYSPEEIRRRRVDLRNYYEHIEERLQIHGG